MLLWTSNSVLLCSAFGASNSEAYFQFDVPPSQQTFVIRLLDPALIQQARAILAATEGKHVMGKIVKAPAFYNTPLSFHLDPHSIQFFDFAIEVCDGSITYTQEHLEEVGGSFLPGNTWCPWGSRLKAEIAPPEGAAQALTAVSAASFSEVALAPASIATIFGNGLTDRTESASETPWPVSLAGISVRLRTTAAGSAPEYKAQLAFASASQVNLFVPNDVPDGVTEISLNTADGRTLKSFSRIERFAPALFHIGPDLRGFAAAILVRLQVDGSVTRESLVRSDPASGVLQPAPIRFGSAAERLFLELYGTGLRNGPAGSVSVRIDDRDAPVLFAGPHPVIPGLDQVNVELPSTLSAPKEVQLQLTINKELGSIAANDVRLMVE
jgi:uncharacterized protein (TIGR03437 family)